MKSDAEIRDDSDIADAIARVLADHAFQRHEAQWIVRQVPGVIGVTNDITVTPPVPPESVKAVIEEAFRREAEADARHVRVEVSDHTAKLYGQVHTLQEAAPRGPLQPRPPAPPPSRATWRSRRDDPAPPHLWLAAATEKRNRKERPR